MSLFLNEWPNLNLKNYPSHILITHWLTRMLKEAWRGFSACHSFNRFYLSFSVVSCKMFLSLSSPSPSSPSHITRRMDLHAGEQSQREPNTASLHKNRLRCDMDFSVGLQQGCNKVHIPPVMHLIQESVWARCRAENSSARVKRDKHETLRSESERPRLQRAGLMLLRVISYTTNRKQYISPR